MGHPMFWVGTRNHRFLDFVYRANARQTSLEMTPLFADIFYRNYADLRRRVAAKARAAREIPAQVKA